MWRSFSFFVFLLLGLFFGNKGWSQDVIHNLEPEWTYFDEDQQGFLPAVMQTNEGQAISFRLSAEDYGQFYLRVILVEPAYLFNGNRLLSSIPEGVTHLKVDSLIESLNGTLPLFTIYSDKLSSGVRTEIVSSNLTSDLIEKERINNPSFRNYFIVVGVLLLIILVILRSAFSDVFAQYTDLLRLVDLKTMDELIYKLRFFSTPNLYFIINFSLTIGWLLMTFNEHHPNIISSIVIEVTGDTFGSYMFMWLRISILVGLVLFGKYLLVALFSALFSFNTQAVHYASHLRLVFWTILILGSLVIVDEYFVLPWLVHVIYIGTLTLTILRITLIFLRLMRLGSNTILHLLLYLCATELIPFVFIYKLVIG